MQQSGNQYYQKWRSALDLLARISVVTGGMGVIAAVVMIFFYLLYVVFPLFLPASAKQLQSYALPEATIGKTLLLDMEEQNQLAARFTDNGQVIFFDVATGKTVLTEKVKLPSDATITSFAQASPVNSGAVVYGLSNGKAVIVKQEYGVSFNNNVRTIQPSLLYPLGEEALVVDESGAKLEQITAQLGEESTTLAAKTAEHIRLVSFEKEQSLFADEASLKRTDGVLNLPGEGVTRLLIDKDGQQLFVVSANGRVASYDVSDKTAPSLKQAVNVVPSDQRITAINFLNGDLSLMVGDSTGLVTQWSQVRDEQNRSSFQKIREFKVSDKAVTQIFSEQRRKGFVIADALGNFGVYHSTSEKQLITEHAANQLTALALAPRANALLVETGDNQIQFWQLDNEHPEVSIKSLWQSVWYESYAKPDYVWQSSASNSDFEPKYSFVPLVFGTLKAAFYAMLVAIPMALMGAIYTAYFMAPGMRQIVKPSIEIMGALPTVILGFLAGLWLAPFIEEHLAGIFTFLLFLPVVILLFAYYWQYMPKALLAKIPEGSDGLLLIPVILASGWLALQISIPMESVLFNGSLREWMKNSLGIAYDQRNAMVVGIAMGFAVIPSIFSIAEDAIFSVPKHLTVGSLALGATPWQTLSKIVLLTASPGIFSAIMIGFGRAVGETMIVLMATGNTPVMDMSLFQGMRTLAANIAVEMPESEVDSTHYRVLFLAALVLFAFTFLFNTLAEVIRQRLREKYSSL